jgi:hypothetical protein
MALSEYCDCIQYRSKGKEGKRPAERGGSSWTRGDVGSNRVNLKGVLAIKLEAAPATTRAYFRFRSLLDEHGARDTDVSEEPCLRGLQQDRSSQEITQHHPGARRLFRAPAQTFVDHLAIPLRGVRECGKYPRMIRLRGCGSLGRNQLFTLLHRALDCGL